MEGVLHMKKLLSMILVLTLALSLFAGCAGDEEGSTGSATSSTEKDSSKKTNDKESGATDSERAPIQITTILRDAEVSPAEIELYQDLEAKTGVIIDWQTGTQAGWEEKRALLFASNDLPDAFFGSSILTDDDVLKYGTQGMLVAIEEYITPEIMPNFSAIVEAHPEYLKAITAPDGHIYALPSFDDGIVTTTTSPLYMNKDWLEAVGMDAPTTSEELYEVLKAFKDNDANGNGDPSDEIPYTFEKNCSDLFGMFGIIDDFSTHIDVVDGQVYYTASTDEYKEALSYFRMLFEEGLIDSEAFTHDGKAYKAKLKKEERTVGMFQTWRSTGWAIEEGDESYMPVGPMVGPNGDQIWPERINGLKTKGAFAVTAAAEDPEYIMAWIDNIFDPEFAVQASFAMKIGYHVEYNAEGKLDYTDIKATPENRTGLVPKGTERIFAMTEVSAGLLASPPAHMIEKQWLDTFYADYYKGEFYPKVFFTMDEVERLSILKTDIITYTNEMYAKWIAIGGIEDEWDDYVKKLNDMGLEEMVQIHQDALDRFNQ